MSQLPITDIVLQISDIFTEIGEKFVDKISEEVKQKRITVPNANSMIKQMMEVQKDQMRIDEMCSSYRNAFKAVNILKCCIQQLEDKIEVKIRENEEKKKKNKIPLEIHYSGENYDESICSEKSPDDNVDFLMISDEDDHPIVPSSSPRKVRRSRSLTRMAKTVMKKVHRSLSASRRRLKNIVN